MAVNETGAGQPVSTAYQFIVSRRVAKLDWGAARMHRYRDGAGWLRSSSSIARAAAPNRAPALHARPGPPTIQSTPAQALAVKVATPTISSKIPNAVPRKCSGAASATAAESRPCVIPICRPHSAPPSMVVQRLSAQAKTRFAKIRTTVPIPSCTYLSMWSASTPNG